MYLGEQNGIFPTAVSISWTFRAVRTEICCRPESGAAPHQVCLRLQAQGRPSASPTLSLYETPITERLSPRRVSSWFTKGQWELSRQSSMLYWREDGGKHTHGGGGVGWRKHSWGWAREIRSLLNHHGRSTVPHQILLITRLSVNVFCDSAMLFLLSTG